MAEKLVPGNTFPDLTLQIAGGGTMSLPKDLNTSYSVILFYRGHW